MNFPEFVKLTSSEVFCKNLLTPNITYDLSSSDTVPISTGRLYDTFEAWVSVYKNDFSISAQSLCPYNMFDAFLHQTYKPTSDGKWNLVVYTNLNLIKYYIYIYDQTFETPKSNNRDFQSFKKWCIRKYGSLNMNNNNNEIETEINSELINYFI